jgi:hypothetical protein
VIDLLFKGDARSYGAYQRPSWPVDDEWDKKAATSEQIIGPEKFQEHGIRVFPTMPEKRDLGGGKFTFPEGTDEQRFFLVEGKQFVMAAIEKLKSQDDSTGGILDAVEKELRTSTKYPAAKRGRPRTDDSPAVWSARAALALIRASASEVMQFRAVFETHRLKDAERGGSFLRQQCLSDEWMYWLEKWIEANPHASPNRVARLRIGIMLNQVFLA